MDVLNTKIASDLWKISERRISKLCAEGRIHGAVKISGVWLLPPGSIKPKDSRIKSGRYINTKKMKYSSNENTDEAESQLTQDITTTNINAIDNKQMAPPRPRIISLFSGCGGLDLGFEQAGYDRVYANDFDKDAQAIFRLNLGEIDGRDIHDVDEHEIPDGDILTAGFPCQPFSNAGNRKGVHDSRGMLYKECLRIIQAKMPQVVLFENVKGLLSTNYIDGRSLVDVITTDLETMNGLGYNVTYKLLNASDYGVPQNRQRVVFIGVRKDLGKTFVFPKKEEKDKLTIRHILDIPSEVPNQKDWPLSPQAMNMIQYIPEGGSWKDIPDDKLPARFLRIKSDMKRYRSPNFYRRFSLNEISGTITASAQPENCGIIHPLKNRRYNIREIARIQTFPDDFLFLDDSLKNITAMYKVIGNAVPVLLAKKLANTIMEQVFMESAV
jgi:DNA (cytosine-5)-methyltransferase 1